MSGISFEKVSEINRTSRMVCFRALYRGVDSVVVFVNEEGVPGDFVFVEGFVLEGVLVNQNDIFTTWEYGKYRVTLVCPVTPALLAKYTHSPLKYHSESYTEYRHSTFKSDKAWIENIIEKKAPTEEIFYEDSTIVIVADSKWKKSKNPPESCTDTSDSNSYNNLYLLAIFKDFSLKTLRDVNLNDLVYARARIYDLLTNRFNLSKEDVLLYFHYRPTFYVPHIHIVHLEGFNTYHENAGRVKLLDDVIDNLKDDGEYYKRRNINYVG